MAYIGCTQKLAKELEGRLTQDEVPLGTGLHGWHANLYSFYDRKFVLLVNDATRFAVFFPVMNETEFQNFERLFRENFKAELTRLGFAPDDVAKALLALGPVTLGKTHNRSVLGTMNDMASCLEGQLHRLGRLPENNEEFWTLTRILNEMPCNSKNYPKAFFPSELMTELLASL